MPCTIIEIENVSKQYRLGLVGSKTIVSDLQRFVARVRGNEDPALRIGVENKLDTQEGDYVWALRDINVKIQQGDVIGIIGKNGAGKSTLLKILSKVTTPTTGSIKVKGRIASLLEVGTGFHPDLTGRENLFQNGAILGMKKAEIKRKFDEIVDFAGVEKYIDTPVKRYSTGMYVRLAFAVAAHLEPEILIIDEVLAVGDREFQNKCFGKMEDVSKGGRTILFVSHNLNALQRICNRGILLTNGNLVYDGNIDETINKYLSSAQFSEKQEWFQNESKPLPHFTYCKIDVAGKQPNLSLIINFKVKFPDNNEYKPAFVSFNIDNAHGLSIMQAIPQEEPFISANDQDKTFQCKIHINGIIPGKYYLSPWIGSQYFDTYDFPRQLLSFEVIDSPIMGRTVDHPEYNGYFVPQSIILNK
jgi:lipopolysaccharide transport system ATP-binding protein